MRRSRKKPLWIRVAKTCIVIACICVCIHVSFLTYMIFRYSHMPIPKNADYAIVLGARVKGTAPSLSLQYRIDAAAEYLQENPNTLAIVSGGKGAGEDISEAEAMKRGLIKRDINPSRIIMEDKAENTYENIVFSKALIPSDAKKGVIITNDYHVYRGTKIAEKQGLRVSGLAAKTPKIAIVKSYMREYAALTKYMLTGQI